MPDATDDPRLPRDLNLAPGPQARPRRRFREAYLLVLLVPVFMFTGAVMGLYFQPPAVQRFYALTGLQPGAGSETPIALPPEIELPPKMAETMLPSDVVDRLKRMGRARGTTTLLVTHDNRILDRADRILTLEDGRIVRIEDRR